MTLLELYGLQHDINKVTVTKKAKSKVTVGVTARASKHMEEHDKREDMVTIVDQRTVRGKCDCSNSPNTDALS